MKILGAMKLHPYIFITARGDYALPSEGVSLVGEFRGNEVHLERSSWIAAQFILPPHAVPAPGRKGLSKV